MITQGWEQISRDIDDLPSDEGGKAIERMHPTDRDKLKSLFHSHLEAAEQRKVRQVLEDLPVYEHNEFCRAKGEQFKKCLFCLKEELTLKHLISTKEV